ncbi:MAG: hypothetical protein HYS13_20350 [Planctomycetia bacterium]|nr:hypothetical protein [Planctomycetia bacterium]
MIKATKLMTSLLAVAVLAAVAGQASAQETKKAEQKPLVVACIPSYDALMDDLSYIGKLSNQPDLATNVQGLLTLFAGGLDGLDKTKPIGMTFALDPTGQPDALVFLPVKDLDKLLESLQAFVQNPEDAGEGIKEFRIEDRPFYVKGSDGWAYFTTNKGSLTNVPKEPLALLGGLEKDYDFGMRLNVQSIPEQFRQIAIGGMMQGFEGALQPEEDESEEEFQARKALAKAQIDQLIEMVNDADQITIGFSIDAEKKKSYFDFSLTALAGSKTAQRMQVRTMPTMFSGFVQDRALGSLIVTQKLAESDIEPTLQAIGGARAQMIRHIEKNDKLDERRKETVKKLAGKLMDQLDATIKAGKIDMAAAALGKGPVTFVVGAQVADGAAADKAMTELVDEFKTDAPIEFVKEAATVKGIVFRKVVPPAPDDEAGKAILGKEPSIMYGGGKNVFYVAVGDDPQGALESVMKAGTRSDLPPFQLEVAVGPVLKAVALAQPDNPVLGAIAQGISDDSNDDHVRIYSRTIKNGATGRLEAEEGVIKLIGTAAGLAVQFGGAGGF